MKHEKVHMFTDDFEAMFLNPFKTRADHLPTPPPWVSSESSDEPVEDDEQIQDNWPPPKPSTTLFHPLQDYFHRPSTVLRPPSPTQGGPCRLLLSLLLPDPTGHPPLGPPGLPLQAHPRLQVTPSPLPNTLEAAERRLRNRRMKERRNEKKRLARATPLGAPAPPKGQGPDVWSQHQLPPKPPTKVQPQSQRQKWWANAKKRGREQDGRLISLRGRRYGYPSLSALLGEIREAGEDGEEEAVGVEREDDQEAWFLEGFEDLFPAAAVAVGRLGRGPSSGGDG
ncbi:hypothetical protein H2201_004979 [Coniosporium apollinis]|uniref:BZIP domain-containing protein n=1 Tax=Coniosporium apollinis TaxID=61459 RepID=A0ABQ9NXT2_9PEZI|nr:hypothetical protein H2201_004979 [Coniosporium apollinis]